jgi:hypothetical protein
MSRKKKYFNFESSFIILIFLFLFLILFSLKITNRNLNEFIEIFKYSPKIIKNFYLSNKIEKKKFNIQISVLDIEILKKDLNKTINSYKKLKSYDFQPDNQKNLVTVKILDNNQIIKGKAKIKGHAMDHWHYENYSLRIKLNKNFEYENMQEFNFQKPETRGFLNEWYFHKFLEFNNLIHLNIMLVEPIFNNKRKKIFLIEETFYPEILFKLNKKEGLVFKLFTENLNNEIFDYENKKELSKFIKEKIYLEKQINSFIKNEILANKIFDIEKIAKIFAISEVWGYKHGIHSSQIRFYFNPITKLVEPIGYDMSLIYNLDTFGPLNSVKYKAKFLKTKNYVSLLLKDETFLKELNKQIKIMCDKEHLIKFFEKIKYEAELNKLILYKSFWYKEFINKNNFESSKYLPFDKDVLFENQKIALKSYGIN